MKRFPYVAGLVRIAAVLVLSLALVSCATYTPPNPQINGVVDPAMLPSAVRTAEWDIGAVRYVWNGHGINYYEAGLFPALLLVRNKSGRAPIVYPEECRGIGPGGVEYAPYPVATAAEVVFASTAYKKSAEAAVVGGLTGGAVGAGLGALIGSGFNGGWGAGPGALIGAGVGILGGAALAQQPSMEQYRATLYQDIATYSWRATPIAPMALMPGYLYFPANLGIHSLRVVLRYDNHAQTLVVPINNPIW